MIRTRTVLLVLPALLSVGFTGPAFAQAQNVQPQNEQRKARETEASPKAEVVALDFPGGTVQEYVDALRKVAPGCNVLIATPEVGALPLPGVQLADVTVPSALELLEGDAWQLDREDRRNCSVRVSEIKSDVADARSVFRVHLECNRIILRSERVFPQVHIWSVTELLSSGMTAESILTAIETSMEILGGERHPAQIRFHGETGLVLVSGDDAQRSAIGRVVDGLEQSANERKLAKEREGQNIALLGFRDEVRLLRSELAKQALAIEQLQAGAGD